MEKNTKIQFLIIIVLIIILGITFTLCVSEINSKANDRKTDNVGMEQEKKPNEVQNNTNIETKCANEITDNQNISDVQYESTSADESVILVTDDGSLSLKNAQITKTGDTTNTENSEFYGVNASILSKTSGTINISDSNIITEAKGANAIFATGENAKIYVSNTKIETSLDSSRGLDSTYGGYIEADNVTIDTKGGSSATLATDRGEGTVIARNSKLSTAGSGSPIIYSTGNITLEASEGTATGAQMVVVEGKNTATVNNSNLICSAKGNRGEVDKCGVMIYQSMSGDAGEGTGTFNSTNSTLMIDENSEYYESAPLFFSTNTKAVFNLENNELKYGSNILLKAEGTEEWGNKGSNGSDVIVNSKNQKLVGNIQLDNLSTLELNLLDKSSYEGTINAENTAKNIVVNLDETSTWKLTGDTYITELKNADTQNSNIDYNGYKLYVNGKLIN